MGFASVLANQFIWCDLNLKTLI